MTDETIDISKQERLTVVLRYVNQKGIINERFLTFVQATHPNAESLTSYLLATLEENQLDPTCI